MKQTYLSSIKRFYKAARNRDGDGRQREERPGACQLCPVGYQPLCGLRSQPPAVPPAAALPALWRQLRSSALPSLPSTSLSTLRKMGSLAAQDLNDGVAALVTLCHLCGGGVPPPPQGGQFQSWAISGTASPRTGMTTSQTATSLPHLIQRHCILVYQMRGTCPSTRCRRGLTLGTLVPSCFELSDQSFPAVLTAERDGECIKVIQVENASLANLTDTFPGGYHWLVTANAI